MKNVLRVTFARDEFGSTYVQITHGVGVVDRYPFRGEIVFEGIERPAGAKTFQAIATHRDRDEYIAQLEMLVLAMIKRHGPAEIQNAELRAVGDLELDITLGRRNRSVFISENGRTYSAAELDAREQVLRKIIV